MVLSPTILYFAGAGLQPVSTAQYRLVTSEHKNTSNNKAQEGKRKGNAPFLRQPNKNTSNNKAQEGKRKRQHA